MGALRCKNGEGAPYLFDSLAALNNQDLKLMVYMNT